MAQQEYVLAAKQEQTSMYWAKDKGKVSSYQWELSFSQRWKHLLFMIRQTTRTQTPLWVLVVLPVKILRRPFGISVFFGTGDACPHAREATPKLLANCRSV